MVKVVRKLFTPEGEIEKELTEEEIEEWAVVFGDETCKRAVALESLKTVGNIAQLKAVLEAYFQPDP